MELLSTRKSYLNIPLSELQFISIDVETTGLYPDKGDRICEIAAVRFEQRKKNKEPMGVLWSFVNPLRHIPEEVCRIHGITDEIVQNAPPFSELIPSFLHFINDFILIA